MTTTETILAILVGLAYTAMVYSYGYRKGVDYGVIAAGEWRGKLIEDYKTMVEKAIRQRDEARALSSKEQPTPRVWN